MCFDTKNQLNLIRWCWVVLLAVLNIKLVQSVIVGPKRQNATCETITYLKDQMYQCELTLQANELSERLLINLNQFQLNCTDTIYIYDGPTVSGDPAYKLTCENKTGSMIYSSNNSLSLELVTGNDAGFDSPDFYLVYTSFNGSENGCDGFVCQDENKYCIPQLNMCDYFIHCSDKSDEELHCAKYDDGGDTVKLIALVCFASFILLLGCIWLCAHTRKIMRNRAAIQRNGVVNNN